MSKFYSGKDSNLFTNIYFIKKITNKIKNQMVGGDSETKSWFVYNLDLNC